MSTYKLIFLLAALCSNVSVFSQSFIGVDGGVSLPLGNWGKTSTATEMTSINGTVNDKSGYAKTGGSFAVDGAWFFSKHFGIGGQFNSGTHSLKGVDSLSQGYEESFDVDQTSTSVTNYKLWSILAGLYYDWHFTRKLALTARALAGVAHVSTPAIHVAIEDGGIDDPPVIQESAGKAAFAADGGVGLQFGVLKFLAIRLRADYFYTKPAIAIRNSGRNNNAGREVNQYDQPLSSMNFSLGVAYTIGHKN
jgi:hypothetical protein